MENKKENKSMPEIKEVKTIKEESNKAGIKEQEKKKKDKKLEELTITELVGLKDGVITLSNFLSQQYRVLEPYMDEESQALKTKYMSRHQYCDKMLITILDEIEKRMKEICL